ncbi:MAG: PEP-CTERM-box response regulator transcription factor [Deltaproteobacteria bacterium]|nr:PEP-CTERM-box response regulator transcription factor [Deltaproteobacteria bacterium]
MPKLLIVEDDQDLRTQLRWALGHDYEILEAGDRPSALEILRRDRPPAVILDLGLPPAPDTVEEGFRALSEILAEDALVKVIVATGHGEKKHALRAIGQGAYDFLSKPIQVDELRTILSRAIHVYRLEREHRELQYRFDQESFEGMLGTSPQMQRVYTSVRKVATTDVPVLLMGENGTGKELVARAIHRQSSRRHHAFVAINCGAIPETLLESELFGHEKGAFTGAHIQRRGRIEKAHGGTLFLDEIGELSTALQVKLLRFLQEHTIERVGGRGEIVVDSRVIAATNADLKQAMKDGRFREDLYYRIGVVVISLPPLCDREGDILLLANHLLRRYAAESNRKITGFTTGAIRSLEAHRWPGNVRELENRIKRAVIMADGHKVTPEDLELTSPHAKYEGRGLREAREALERDLIRQALARNRGNMTKAAAQLRISRPTLYELMEKLGIQRRQ